MDVADVVAADVEAELPDRLEEREDLDVADRAADLGDDHVDVVGGQTGDAALDLVGDVRDHLDGLAEVVAPALGGEHRRVDRAGGGVRVLRQVLVDEPLVVAEVEVGLAAVVGDEHLAVLERVHRAGVDVDVRVELLHGDPEAPGLQQSAEGGGGDALAERAGHATRHEDVFRHGLTPYPAARRLPADHLRSTEQVELPEDRRAGDHGGERDPLAQGVEHDHDDQRRDADREAAGEHHAEADGGADRVGAGVAEHQLLAEVEHEEPGRGAEHHRDPRRRVRQVRRQQHTAQHQGDLGGAARAPGRAGCPRWRRRRRAARRPPAAAGRSASTGPVTATATARPPSSLSPPVVSRPSAQRAEVAAEALGVADLGHVVDEAEQPEPDGGEQHEVAGPEDALVDAQADQPPLHRGDHEGGDDRHDPGPDRHHRTPVVGPAEERSRERRADARARARRPRTRRRARSTSTSMAGLRLRQWWRARAPRPARPVRRARSAPGGRDRPRARTAARSTRPRGRRRSAPGRGRSGPSR